jgi:primosomal protein N' (replication factor Y)
VFIADAAGWLASTVDSAVHGGTSSGTWVSGSLKLTETQTKILSFLKQNGSLTNLQLERLFPRKAWQNAIQQLIRLEVISAASALTSKAIRPKTLHRVRLVVSKAEVQANWDKLARPHSHALKRRQTILSVLMEEKEAIDVVWLLAACTAREKELFSSAKNTLMQDLTALKEKGLIAIEEETTYRDPLATIQVPQETYPTLTPAQQQALDAVLMQLRSLDAQRSLSPFLLYGVTGSGKTEIYLQAVEETLRLGKQALVLVPEISLTPQAIRRFLARFPGQVGLLHSKLSDGERYDTWLRARAGKIAVIVGARSALFAPLKNIGLIIVDECHDSSYFQGDKPPTFDAVVLAERYARICHAVCILGSATPDVVHYYRAQKGELQLLNLPQRIAAHHSTLPSMDEQEKLSPMAVGLFQHERTPQPLIQIIDMRQELKEGNRSIFSRALQHALQQILEKQQQAILFINRRGAASYVFCRDCGFVLKCPRCDLPLTYHENKEGDAQLMCHFCSYRRGMPKKCPSCGSDRIRHYGTGTQRVEKELSTLFPMARFLRWDLDTTRRKDAHEAIMQQFALHQADVLIGTQMLAKGLDLPLVTLVGIVLADVGLNFPDYRAAERTFQTLMQVAGRAGRSALGGKVILQTFQPQHEVIQAVANQSYTAFYEKEIHYRRILGTHLFNRSYAWNSARCALSNPSKKL